MEITYSNQNRTKIITSDGFAYVKKLNLAGGWESFECERRRNFDRCKGKIKVNGNQFVVMHAHHHAPNPARNDVLKIRSYIKRRAQTTLDGTQAIVGGALAGINSAAPKSKCSVPVIS